MAVFEIQKKKLSNTPNPYVYLFICLYSGYPCWLMCWWCSVRKPMLLNLKYQQKIFLRQGMHSFPRFFPAFFPDTFFCHTFYFSSHWREKIVFSCKFCDVLNAIEVKNSIFIMQITWKLLWNSNFNVKMIIIDHILNQIWF